ncbi:hypothetical protein KKP3664_000010 [Citrobacter phage KKP_3664]|nr:hypothetical protein KKP3664_000010 [Citrobacter phage KKP_3664]
MNTVQSRTEQDAELARLIKEQNVFRDIKLTEMNEDTRRSFWIEMYRRGINDSRGHTEAKKRADNALSAYDEKFSSGNA